MKLTNIEVFCNSDHADDVPTHATFEIDEDLARQIVELQRLVKTHDLYKVERFDSRPVFFDQDTEGHDVKADTWSQTLNVSERDFWFAAFIRHTDTEVKTARQRINDLAAHFGIPLSTPTPSEEDMATFMLERIESGDLPLEDIPVRLARYGLMEPHAFCAEMSERITTSKADALI